MDPAAAAAAAAQSLVDAAALHAVTGGDVLPQGLGMDPVQLAAAAEQLQAIQAALQHAGGNMSHEQAAIAALEQLHNAKPEDVLAHLASIGAVGPLAAAAAAAVDNAHQGFIDGGLDLGDPDGSGGNGDKPLTSKFRGVCWNKKNRRWQAAINSSGKYIYLGSFLQEDEAARAFDRAAIRLRGSRAKLNYALSDYMDPEGNLLDDPRLSAHLQNVLGKEQQQQGKPGKMPGDPGMSAAAAAAAAAEANSMQMAANAATATNLIYSQIAAQHILRHGAGSAHNPYSAAQKHNYGVIEVPDGCSLIAHIPGDEEAFAVLYVGTSIPPGGAGAAVWDGNGAIDLGVFDTDKDARQAAGAVLKLCMFHKHMLVGTITSAAASAAQANAENGGAPHLNTAAAQLGLMLGGDSGPGAGMGLHENQADAAMAAMAAASTGDAAALAQLTGLASLAAGQHMNAADTANQYKELFAWIATYSQPQAAQQRSAPVKPEPMGLNLNLEHPATDSAPSHTEADIAGAEVMAALMGQAHGKVTRDERANTAGVENRSPGLYVGDSDERSSKRARSDDGMAQLKQLGGHKLQDVMRTLLEARAAH